MLDRRGDVRGTCTYREGGKRRERERRQRGRVGGQRQRHRDNIVEGEGRKMEARWGTKGGGKEGGRGR